MLKTSNFCADRAARLLRELDTHVEVITTAVLGRRLDTVMSHHGHVMAIAHQIAGDYSYVAALYSESPSPANKFCFEMVTLTYKEAQSMVNKCLFGIKVVL